MVLGCGRSLPSSQSSENRACSNVDRARSSSSLNLERSIVCDFFDFSAELLPHLNVKGLELVKETLGLCKVPDSLDVLFSDQHQPGIVHVVIERFQRFVVCHGNSLTTPSQGVNPRTLPVCSSVRLA